MWFALPSSLFNFFVVKWILGRIVELMRSNSDLLLRMVLCASIFFLSCWILQTAFEPKSVSRRSASVLPSVPCLVRPNFNWSYTSFSSGEAEPLVTHSFFKAGTGNTLFFVASVIGIALSNGRTPVLSKILPLMTKMKLDLPLINESALGSFRRIQDDGVGIYHKKYRNLSSLVGSSSVYFAGYLQSYKYFHQYKDGIKRQFEFMKTVKDEADALIRNATGGQLVMLVGVHVRRGDFLKNSGTRGLHRTAPEEYFLKTMDSLRSKSQDQLLFIIISDSMEWCRTTISNPLDVRFVQGSTAAVDMAVLTLMDHLVISVGTFGWWSAYLSSAKSVTYYKHWYNKDTETGLKFRPRDFFPPEWISEE